MGKDAEGACCESCRRFGGEDAELPPAAPARSTCLPFDQARILVRERGQEEREVLPTGSVVTVGRAPDNTIVLPSATISRRQCRFTFTEDGRVVVEDLHSACGTFIDGRRQSGEAEVYAGAVVSMGNFELRVTSRAR